MAALFDDQPGIRELTIPRKQAISDIWSDLSIGNEGTESCRLNPGRHITIKERAVCGRT